MTQLAITGLTKGFSGRTVLDHVDLQVPPNSLTAILLDDDAVETILGSLPVHSGTRALRPGKVTVLVRPEQIDIAQIDTPQIDIGARNGAAGLAGSWPTGTTATTR